MTLQIDTKKLPPEVFNYPLTVRSQVSEAWAAEGKYVKVTQGASVQAPIVKNVDGGLYVYYGAVPTNGVITLESTTERPVVKE